MDNLIQSFSPEIWGGIECTINRVGDEYIDQLEMSDHYHRGGDIEALLSLGMKRFRYPVLWEKHQPVKHEPINWDWTSAQLTKIREAGVEVIAGLVHHGSGPIFTNLLDPAFPLLLADYAKLVATRFPWIRYYTPVNEPLTTARFSGLYGLWYPHAADDQSFLKMLLNELKGTVMAMQEIRKINPDAVLIQTEDLGKTYSTPRLRYQAEFENSRRWLTFDLLAGIVDENHTLWKYFIDNGISEDELLYFVRNPCPPGLIGFNHYLTSERFLDDDLAACPAHTHGGNGRHRYADVEAIRVPLKQPHGLKTLLREAWHRYHIPMAITEVHLHCHREEQLRWFRYVRETCTALIGEDIRIEGITAWALLGSFGWNKLLTEPDGDYESGAFDVRNGTLRTTALANYIAGMARNSDHEHHFAQGEGWWQRPSRFRNKGHVENDPFIQAPRPIIILGRTGTLGQAMARTCVKRNVPHVLLDRQACDVTNIDSIRAAVEEYLPWAIINCTGFVRVDDAELEREACFRINTLGVENLATICNDHAIALVNFSSDLVFNGQKNTPYLESDQPCPLNVYGQTKFAAEAVMSNMANALTIRTSAFFSPWDAYNFVHYVRTALSRFETVTVVNDVFVSPTFVPHLVDATLDLLMDAETGVWHLANRGAVSWSEWAYKIADSFGLDSAFIRPVSSADAGWQAARPAYSVLLSERGQMLPDFAVAMQELKHLQGELHAFSEA